MKVSKERDEMREHEMREMKTSRERGRDVGEQDKDESENGVESETKR